MTDEERLSPSEWEQRFGLTVLDPDGWDRRNFEEDWARPLTRAEFVEKLWVSTIQFDPAHTPLEELL